MALTGATLTTLSNILKELYLPPVQDQLNNNVLLLSRIDKDTDSIVGKFAVVPIHTARTGGIGGRAELQQLPDPGNQAYLRATYDLKWLYGRFRFTGPSHIKSAKDAGAFLEVMKSEIDFLRNDLKKDLARQVYGDGTAVIGGAFTAVSGGASGPNVCTLGSSEAIDKGQLYVGMFVDVWPLTSGVPSATACTANQVSGSYAFISAVNAATPSVTITSPTGAPTVALATGQGITRQGAGIYTSSWASNEIDGLQSIVSAAANTFGGISASTNPIWDNIRDTGLASLTIDRMVQDANKANRAGSNLTALISSYGMQRQYFNLLQSQVRFTEPTKLTGGFSALNFAGGGSNLPFIADLDAPYGKIFFLDESTLKVFADNDWDFIDADGNTMRMVANFDAFEGVLTRYMQLGALRRNTNVLMAFNAGVDTGY